MHFPPLQLPTLLTIVGSVVSALLLANADSALPLLTAPLERPPPVPQVESHSRSAGDVAPARRAREPGPRFRHRDPPAGRRER
jgi:hypothetical protein